MLGLYGAPADKDGPLLVYNIRWRPSDESLLVQLRWGPGSGRLVLLDRSASEVWDVPTKTWRATTVLVSPDSRWAALDQSWASGDEQMIEFIKLDDPAVALLAKPDERPSERSPALGLPPGTALDIAQAWKIPG